MYFIKLALFGFYSLLACFYLAFSPAFAMPIYSLLLFPAPKYPVGNYDVEMIPGCAQQESFFLNSAGEKLHGRIFKKPGAKKWILYSHGNGSNVSVLGMSIEILMETGASVFVYDYRGYGRSEGAPSLEGICDDACAAFDFLVKTEKVEPCQIVLYGESLGSAVSTHLAQKRECAGLILHGAYLSIRKAAEDRLPFFKLYPTWLFPHPDLDNLEPLKGDHPPLLIVHGRNDLVIPVQHSLDLYRAAKGPKQLMIVENAVHWDAPFVAREEFQNKVRTLLNQAGPEAKYLIGCRTEL